MHSVLNGRPPIQGDQSSPKGKIIERRWKKKRKTNLQPGLEQEEWGRLTDVIEWLPMQKEEAHQNTEKKDS